MNKKFLITLGLMTAFSVSTIAVMAESTIYTDGLGRMHFLGRDAASNTGAQYNYTNSAEQDLTRRLYENSSNEITNDTSYDQHPLKNYENTFPDSRFNTTHYWKTKYSNNVDDVKVNAKNNSKTVKGTMTFEKGATESLNPAYYGSTAIQETEKNVIKSSSKKHWWSKN